MAEQFRTKDTGERSVHFIPVVDREESSFILSTHETEDKVEKKL